MHKLCKGKSPKVLASFRPSRGDDIVSDVVGWSSAWWLVTTDLLLSGSRTDHQKHEIMGIIMKKHSKKHPKTSQIHQKVDLEGALGGEGGVALWGVLLRFKKDAKRCKKDDPFWSFGIDFGGHFGEKSHF